MYHGSGNATDTSLPANPAAYDRVKHRVYQIMEAALPGDPVGRAFQVFLPTLIIANIVAMVLGTMAEVQARYATPLAAFEAASVLVFSLEYLLRLWCVDRSPGFSGGFRGRVRYALKPMALVDLAAILPFWLSALGMDLRALRMIRLLRVFRIAKLARYSYALQTLSRVLLSKKEELSVLMALVLTLLFCASSLIYFAEHDAQPEAFSSVPASMWWAVATLTTVGYGDMYPVTALGKLLASVVAVLGIGLFALPTGILGAEFVNELSKKSVRCPHCGGEFQGGSDHGA